MKLGFIGAGKVGTTLAKYLAPHHAIIGFASRSYKSAEEAARFTESHAFERFEDLVPLCDTVFITVPDGQTRTSLIVAAHFLLRFSRSVKSVERSAIQFIRFSRCLLRPKPIESSIRHSSRSKATQSIFQKWSPSSPMRATWFK